MKPTVAPLTARNTLRNVLALPWLAPLVGPVSPRPPGG